jgi:glycosyltransferase involved in cell wall biosynthesis
MKGWLVNDCLTCIPGTKTLWHNLLDWLPGLIDKTNGYTSFSNLAYKIESDLKNDRPDYIIRNATFFRPIDTYVPTISLLQDIYQEGSSLYNEQIHVINTSNLVVFNSPYTFNKYKNVTRSIPYKIIPIGTNSELFSPAPVDKTTDIVYVGSSATYPKGFDVVQKLINETDYTFNLVMKDSFTMSHPRVAVYNMITQEELVTVLNKSKMLICTSQEETLHLGGIEAGFCNIPIVTSSVGIYPSIKNDSRWGIIVDDYTIDDYKEKIKYILNNLSNFSPRESFIDNKLDLNACKEEWQSCITQIL